LKDSYTKLLGYISVDFDEVDKLLIRYFVFFKYWRENGSINGTVHQLFIDFEKAYDSVRREVLYNIFIEFVIPIN